MSSLVKIYSGSKVGKYHLDKGQLNQDCKRLYNIIRESDTTYISVADGLGSKPYSGLGAEYACGLLETILRSKFDKLIESGEESILRLFITVRNCYERWCNERGITNLHDAYCTYSGAMRIGDKIIILNVGDSPINILYNDDTVERVCKDGEFANETNSIFSRSASGDFNFKIFDIKDLKKIVICSDGAALTEKGIQYINADNIEEILEHCHQVQHDDATIAVMEFIKVD
jgi:serine/threonine protein phosphatase PrpC